MQILSRENVCFCYILRRWWPDFFYLEIENANKWLTFIPRTEKLWQRVIEIKKLNQDKLTNAKTQNKVPAIEPLPHPVKEIVFRRK